MATNTVRVGLVGCGNVAVRSHIPAYRALPDHFELRAVADPVDTRRDLGRLTAGLETTDAHAEAHDLITRTDIDLVDICVPQQYHASLVEAAAAAGHNIICEKPLATVPADGRAAIAAADRAGVLLALMHNYLFFPEIIAAKDIIDAGELGTIRVVIVNFLGVVDSAGASGYRPQWRHDLASSGGGVLMDMLHGLYLANHLLGRATERVSAHVTSHEPRDSVESLALCRLEAGDAAALVNIGWGVGPGGIEVVGSDGRLTIRHEGGGTSPWAPFESLTVTTALGSYEPRVATSESIQDKIQSSVESALADVAEAIRVGRPLAADGHTGLQILETTLACYESATTGRSVPLPLDEDSPLFRRGALGLEDLEAASWSLVQQHELFGLRRSKIQCA